MSITKYPQAYRDINEEQSKNVALVVQIEGITELFTLGDIYTRVKYGDPGLIYGMADLVYGGLRRIDNALPYLTLDGSLTISQRLEPEQGRASISTFTLIFNDQNGYMTKIISPGVEVDEILGGKEVKIFMGFVNSSWPDDYYTCFRGTVSGVSVTGPKVTMNLADPNQKRRRQIFNVGQTRLRTAISDTDTTIPVLAATDFYSRVLGPDLAYTSDIKTWIQVEDEFMEYTAYTTNTITVTRAGSSPVGYAATAPAVHAIDTDVINIIEIGPTNAVTMALRLMLSGWEGPWLTGIKAEAFGETLDLFNTSKNVIKLFFDQSAIENYSLIIGDYIYIADSPSNNGTYNVIGFDEDSSQRLNRIIYLDRDLVQEYPAVGTFSIRSQFDVYPVAAGVKMRPTEVDIDTHLVFRDRFLIQPFYDMQFVLSEKQSGKEFIESQIYLPLGAYSLTRYGRVSMGLTRPPTLIDDKLIEINKDNVVNPANTMITRALNNRRFYNEIDYSWDYNYVAGLFGQTIRAIDFDSYNRIGQDSSMTIEAKGVRDAISSAMIATKTTSTLLTRYKNVAFEIMIDVNMRAGSLIESGDIIMLTDNGDLKIPNLSDGTRNLGSQLFETLDRQLDVKTGFVRLKLLSGIFDTSQDRYGVISPRSFIMPGSTIDTLKMSGLNEFTKWTAHVGDLVRVHSMDFTYDHITNIVGFSVINTNWMIVGALPIVPPADCVIDIVDYPNNSDKVDEKTYKALYVFLSPSVIIVSGSSNTIFTVNVGDEVLFFNDAVLIIHSEDYVVESAEVRVIDITGQQITVDTDLGFTPSAGQRVDMIGFPDHNGAYRYF